MNLREFVCEHVDWVKVANGQVGTVGRPGGYSLANFACQL
jgi:hypothetical protein